MNGANASKWRSKTRENANITRFRRNPRNTEDRIWKAIRILRHEMMLMRTAFDAIERKANRIAVSESRSKHNREYKAGDKIAKPSN